MKLNDKEIAKLAAANKCEIHPFDATCDTGPNTSPIAVTFGQVILADDGSYWVTDRNARGHKIARKMANRRGNAGETTSTTYQSCPVRQATESEVADFQAAQKADDEATIEAGRKAAAVDDYR